MKTIGLIGGMSWESTAVYYKLLNQGVGERLGGLHSASIAMVSVDFAPIETLQHQGDWAGTARILGKAARGLEKAGADFFLICTNTMHRVADEVAREVDIPLVHIADATAKVLAEKGIGRVGLLGTAFTMEQAFYKGRLETRFGLEVLVPEAPARKAVHDIIYQELCQGILRPESRSIYLDIIHDLGKRGAGAVILGCTEIGMLVCQDDTAVPLLDTTQIHAGVALDMALEKETAP
jgi:aspartate racemase